MKIDGIKVFSATTWQQRQDIGEAVTDWLAQHRTLQPVSFVVTQSSDDTFHCLSITLFYRTK